ncbi:hypothetical protein B0T21DRAFT_345524 [Apiosordaria backusii]|uniref:Uncharacterized protein n=1 Tax=Apiosordaria backusii TaxID=314023 RepID=A0AA40K0Q4_9PEZI|nr:hypothetical protein B0T21DRAFT_345524 [Apiosordaria backusii]
MRNGPEWSSPAGLNLQSSTSANWPERERVSHRTTPILVAVSPRMDRLRAGINSKVPRLYPELSGIVTMARGDGRPVPAWMYSGQAVMTGLMRGIHTLQRPENQTQIQPTRKTWDRNELIPNPSCCHSSRMRTQLLQSRAVQGQGNLVLVSISPAARIWRIDIVPLLNAEPLSTSLTALCRRRHKTQACLDLWFPYLGPWAPEAAFVPPSATAFSEGPEKHLPGMPFEVAILGTWFQQYGLLLWNGSESAQDYEKPFSSEIVAKPYSGTMCSEAVFREENLLLDSTTAIPKTGISPRSRHIHMLRL